MKLISVVTPTYNEAENVEEVYRQVQAIFQALPQCDYEHIFIDNASGDRTVAILKGIAAKDQRVKIIVNARNFGSIRSPFYGLLQAQGDAATIIGADLQDPPELIPQFIRKWEEGYKIVITIKKQSQESRWLFGLRKLYYRIVATLADIDLIKDFNGFGFYDQSVIQILRTIQDPYPYLRGLICEIGFQRAEVEYVQPARKHGISKNSFYLLYDIAMLGMTNHSKVPLRLATMLGFALSIFFLVVGATYLAAKLIFWNTYTIGIAPVVVGLFFFASVQLMFTGILGEYIGSIHTKVLNRPLVVEKERINFD